MIVYYIFNIKSSRTGSAAQIRSRVSDAFRTPGFPDVTDAGSPLSGSSVSFGSVLSSPSTSVGTGGLPPSLVSILNRNMSTNQQLPQEVYYESPPVSRKYKESPPVRPALRKYNESPPVRPAPRKYNESSPVRPAYVCKLYMCLLAITMLS